MSIRSLVWAGLVLCTTMPVSASEPQLKFSREIQSPVIKQDELLSVILDDHVFGGTRGGFPDLRVFDDKGKGVPFLIRKKQSTGTKTRRTTWAATAASVIPRDDGSLEIRVQRSLKDPAPTGLTLVTPLRDFEQRVSVESSPDEKNWEPAGTETLIFDYSRFMDTRQVGIVVPKTEHRYFRILVSQPTVAQESELLELTRKLRGKSETERTEKLIVDRRPFRIDRIDFWGEMQESQVTGDEKVSYPVKALRTYPSLDKLRTVIDFNVDSPPLTSLEIETPDRNFSRHAIVSISKTVGDKGIMTKLVDGTIHRIDFKNLQRQELKIAFPESRFDRYLIEIENQESPPLTISAVKAEGNVYELLLLGAPDRKYSLEYGSREALPASHDIATLQELLRAGFAPTPATLGTPVSTAGGGALSTFGWSKLLNNKPLLCGVIAVLVAILGYALYHAIKRIDQTPQE